MSGEVYTVDCTCVICVLRKEVMTLAAEKRELEERLERYTRKSESGECLADLFDAIEHAESAVELLRQIRDGLVNPEDEADKFLRDHTPSKLQEVRGELERGQVKFRNHTVAVDQFLCDMYSTMIDPCAEGKSSVKECCDALLAAAVRQREELVEISRLRGELEHVRKSLILMQHYTPINSTMYDRIRALASRLEGEKK